ncbi:MAG TPA: hypothetical protein VJ904_01660 [Tichowtungia sp.]|nr:hypothetical protein [Tichowtungia sp.]
MFDLSDTAQTSGWQCLKKTVTLNGKRNLKRKKRKTYRTPNIKKRHLHRYPRNRKKEKRGTLKQLRFATKNTKQIFRCGAYKPAFLFLCLFVAKKYPDIGNSTGEDTRLTDAAAPSPALGDGW